MYIMLFLNLCRLKSRRLRPNMYCEFVIKNHEVYNIIPTRYSKKHRFIQRLYYRYINS